MSTIITRILRPPLQGGPTGFSVPMAPRLIIILLCLLFVRGRLFVPHVAPSLPGTYEAFAHVFCGVLLGFALKSLIWISPRFCLVALLLITAFEGVAFFLTK